MNIHFNNEILFKSLQTATIHSQEVGSALYGLKNDNSDNDYLNIYTESDENLKSFMWEHHQLQYKESDIDHNFVNLQTFIRNIITGDSTLSFEMVFSDRFKNSTLGEIANFKEGLINFRIIRSYLGFAKRDAKSVQKESKGFRDISGSEQKRMSHFVRGIMFANMLLDNNFHLNLSGLGKSSVNNTSMDDYELLRAIKDGDINDQFKEIHSHFLTKAEELRIKAGDRLNKGQIKMFGESSTISSIDNIVKSIKSKNIDINYGDIFYKTMADGISYGSEKTNTMQ